MLKNIKENKKLQIALIIGLVFIVGFVIAFTIIGISRDNEYLNNNSSNNSNNNQNNNNQSNNSNEKCQYNTGNEQDDEALKKLCEKDGVKREIVTNINNVKGLKKEELENFINLLIDNGAIESINKLSVLTISDIYYARKITSNCYSSKVIDELSNILFNSQLDKYNNIDLDEYFTKVDGYYCSNEVIPGNAGYDYKLESKEEKDNTIAYNYSGEAIAGEDNNEYGAFSIKFKLVNGRYVIDDIKSCSYNLDNLNYNKELLNFCQKTGFNFPVMIDGKELNEEFEYGFGKSLQLNNKNDIRKISDNIVALWDNRTFFNNIKELDNEFKVRFFLKYMGLGCACIQKEFLKENYTHLFGEEVDYKIFSEYAEDALTDNFVCTCYGTGSTVEYEYIKEEHNDKTFNFYYVVKDYIYDEGEPIITNNIKVTFKLNNGYYNLVSIEKVS